MTMIMLMLTMMLIVMFDVRKKRDEPGDDDHVGGDVNVDGGDVDIGDV